MAGKRAFVIFLCFFIAASDANPWKAIEHLLNPLNPFRSAKNGVVDPTYIRTVEDYIVNFMLYTREHPDTFYLFQVDNLDSLANSTFDATKDTKIIIHGWQSDANSNFSLTLKDAYLEKYDANVLVVDWSIQSEKNYVTSRLDVIKVADVVGQMIDSLVQRFNMRSSTVHMVGHSLGAHIAGIAGYNLKTGNISRITGLDPAMPMFSLLESDRLRPVCAEFVDVIHSCGDFLAFEAPLGQVDFYPNGGYWQQPGCGVDIIGDCSHSRSYLYFAESIKTNEFLAVKCINWPTFLLRSCEPNAIPMGEFAPTTARGRYYLKTNDKAPFALGDKIYGN